ncbi:hypothetical protein AJ80_03059 [Polytolypa hystricis UAMH7299]|uniref:Inositol-pentakisphosphate 2-kinase n=1 Tax=Polytolypa hystricis (strain UAMH7299) TaxID=1447883 RepID=A0A2B7YJ76_POLH7|nr:hypothetical protein AJ80_03059 [Polytolypa hystricis UAMH7299]
MGHLESDSIQTYGAAPVTLHMANKAIELPNGTKAFYLAEGGANIIYKIVVPEGTVADGTTRMKGKNPFSGKLLRLRKSIDSGTPYQETMRNFDSLIRPLFRDDELVDQTMIRLPMGFISQCNDQLHIDEACNRRPKSRHGVYLSTKEAYGLLITDMTPTPGSGTCLWEFKPKWLLQSPSAPINAKRCRTCALREMKNFDARLAGERDNQSFCPLDLVSDNFEDVWRATKSMKGTHGRLRVARFLHRNSTLLKLQAWQQQLNAVGLPGLQAHLRERAVSMTLRDCSMYVRVPEDEREPLEIRLGDLDFKSGTGGKLQYWRDTENRLINEGWYSGNRRCQAPTECALQGARADLRLSINAKLKENRPLDGATKSLGE